MLRIQAPEADERTRNHAVRCVCQSLVKHGFIGVPEAHPIDCRGAAPRIGVFQHGLHPRTIPAAARSEKHGLCAPVRIIGAQVGLDAGQEPPPVRECCQQLQRAASELGPLVPDVPQQLHLGRGLARTQGSELLDGVFFCCIEQ